MNDGRERVLTLLALSAVVPRLLQLAGLHPLVWDEVEFFRATDWVSRGLVPYRDFWEHHTPLQWFLYAPFARMTRSPGVPAIIVMRAAQLPLWIATFALLLSWMRRAGISKWARWTATGVALCSSLFMLPAVEYRVDALGCFFFILGLWLVQRVDEGRRYALLAGAAFCLAGFANLRLGPVIVIAALLIRVVRPRDEKWAGNARANWIFTGAAGTLALASLYFVATHSVAIALRRVWSENFIADRLAPVIPGMFFFRLAVQFGVRRFLDQVEFDPSSIDAAGIIVLLAGVFGVARIVVQRWRRPDDAFYLAFLAAANLLFIAAMKFIFNYHFLIVVLTLTPFVALVMERWLPRRAAVPLLAILLVVTTAVSLFRAKEEDTRYQDHIMRAVDAETPPGSKVWDGTGWALRRDPAYPYWFLRMIVTELEGRGTFASYTVRQLLTDPPAAVVADHDARAWMGRHRKLGEAIVAHYLPREIDLWLPGMSARLTPQQPVAGWIVPADGTYFVHASPRLAAHPWFRQPLYFETLSWHTAALTNVTPADALAAPIMFRLNGTILAATRAMVLHRGDRLEVRSGAGVPVGVMLPRAPASRLFNFPPPGVTLEASAPPRWHVPDFSVLTYRGD